MTKLEASFIQLVNKAAGGDLKAFKIFTQLMIRFPEIMKNEKKTWNLLPPVPGINLSHN
jgi:hypothetical protein